MAASHTNVVVLAGRLTKDPLPRGGGEVAALSIASNRYFKKDGATVEETLFVDAMAFGFEAQAALEFLTKGSPVLVEARLELRRWEAEDGSPRQNVRLRVNRLTSPLIRGRTSDPAQTTIEDSDAEPLVATELSDAEKMDANRAELSEPVVECRLPHSTAA